MKKSNGFIGLVMALSLGTSAVAPRPAQAIVGIAHLNPLMVLGGLALGLGSAAGGLVVLVTHCMRGFTRIDGVCVAVDATFTLAGMWGGIILLDGESAAGMRMVEVSDEVGAQAGLSAAQVVAYNQSLDELNAVAEAVGLEMARTGDTSLEASQALWAKYGAAVDSQALGAAQVLVERALSK